MKDPAEVINNFVFPDAIQVRDGASLQPQRGLYPPIEPYQTGFIEVGDGQSIYVEQCGNPEGKPAVFIHGGPGGGGGTDRRRFFDPDRYRIICFDQRGCGSSVPSVAVPEPDMSVNTTWHLVEDLHTIGQELGIESWLVFGGSWGSTLALAYATRYPDEVSELVLRGIFTLRRTELDWYYNDGASHVYPEWWEVFCAPLKAVGHDFSKDNITAYNTLLFDPDPKVHVPAAQAWSMWEAATSYLFYNPSAVEEYLNNPQAAVKFARIENHYFCNGGWMEDGQLLNQVEAIRHIPTVIVQGRYDMCCPADTAYQLHKAMPEAEFHLVLGGHSAFEPMITDKLVEATDRFASGHGVGDKAGGRLHV